MDNERSVQSAKRTIKTGAQYGIKIDHFQAITPRSNLTKLMVDNNVSIYDFEEPYSRLQNCAAAFMSHFLLWKLSVELNEEVTIFEHDAFIQGTIPENLAYRGCISFGQPSYGRWDSPQFVGVNPLTSKRYFPGAHAYRVKPNFAKIMIEQAQHKAAPTDVFLHLDTFSFLEEYYPWPVIARDSFTTIQGPKGILAKHSYVKEGDTYDII